MGIIVGAAFGGLAVALGVVFLVLLRRKRKEDVVESESEHDLDKPEIDGNQIHELCSESPHIEIDSRPVFAPPQELPSSTEELVALSLLEESEHTVVICRNTYERILS